VTQRASAALLAGVMVMTLMGLVLDVPWAHGSASVLLGGYLLSLRGHLSPMANGLLVAASLTTLAVFLVSETPWLLLVEGMQRFAFFATFVSALSLLRLPAYASPLVRACGRAMLRQPPGRRYPILSLGAGVFGVILNIGVLNLFAGMITKSNTLSAANGLEWVQRARQRRMLLAVLRGFSLTPLISPMGIGVAVILSSMPGLEWQDLAPYAFGSALVIFVCGWLIDHLTGPHPPRKRGVNTSPSPAPLGRFVLLLLGIVLLVFLLAWLLSLRLPVATLVGAPLAAWGWLAWQRRRLGGGGMAPACVTLYRKLPWLLGPLGSEVVVLGSAGFMGHLWVGLIDQAALMSALEGIISLGAWNAVLAMLVVLVTAQLGLNPIVTVTLLAGVLPAMDIPGLSDALIGVSLMVGWSLALMSSPLTASMLILSRLSGASPRRIGYRWNGAFMLGVVPLMGIWFLIANFLAI